MENTSDSGQVGGIHVGGAQKYNMQPVESRFLSLHPSSEGHLGYICCRPFGGGNYPEQ